MNHSRTLTSTLENVCSKLSFFCTKELKKVFKKAGIAKGQTVKLFPTFDMNNYGDWSLLQIRNVDGIRITEITIHSTLHRALSEISLG